MTKDPRAGRVHFRLRSRWRADEVLFWVLISSCYFVLPDRLPLITQMLISGLFALSLDLLLGYAGIASLGHAAFFGIGAYAAGLLAQNGWTEPISGLFIATSISAMAAFVFGWGATLLSGVALLMGTLVAGLLIYEIANRLSWITGGDNGLQGMVIDPILGVFEFDLFGRVAFVYTLVIVFGCYLLIRQVVYSPFGLALEAMRDNSRRLPSIGFSVRYRSLLAFTLSGTFAGAAGALLAQTSQFVSLEVLSVDRSLAGLIMLILGGTGRLTGGLIGALLFLGARDVLSTINPVYWNFWLGLILVVVVLLGAGGLTTIFGRLAGAITAKIAK